MFLTYELVARMFNKVIRDWDGDIEHESDVDEYCEDVGEKDWVNDGEKLVCGVLCMLDVFKEV